MAASPVSRRGRMHSANPSRKEGDLVRSKSGATSSEAGPRSVRLVLRRATKILVSVSVLSIAGLTYSGPAMAQSAAPVAAKATAPAVTKATHHYKRACPVTTKHDRMACMVLIRTNVGQKAQASLSPDQARTGDERLNEQSAYVLPSSTAGSGETVAVVDAYNDPNAASDLATYRSDWGLPACGSGSFEQVNENGATSPLPAAAGRTGWDVEESLDIDMVSAICPLCHIILVEASNADTTDLGTGVNAAVSLGADFVSNSYGGSESSSDPTYDTDYYNHPGVAVTASAGDGGYGLSYPAASQYVTSVGGTSLSTASNSRGWTETVWGSSSGGEGNGSGGA